MMYKDEIVHISPEAFARDTAANGSQILIGSKIELGYRQDFRLTHKVASISEPLQIGHRINDGIFSMPLLKLDKKHGTMRRKRFFCPFQHGYLVPLDIDFGKSDRGQLIFVQAGHLHNNFSRGKAL